MLAWAFGVVRSKSHCSTKSRPGAILRFEYIGVKKQVLAEDSLFFSLAEDLKTPLVRIAYKAELGQNGSDSANRQIDEILRTANETLSLLDAYLMGAKVQTEQIALALEPVNPALVLSDAANELSSYAKRFECELRLKLPTVSSSVLTNKNALQTAITAIARVFIAAQDILGSNNKKFIELACYHVKSGMAVGVFHSSTEKMLDAQLLSQARSHVGKAARPFVGLASGASAQLFVAEQILRGIDTNIRTANRSSLSGLAIDLSRCHQLKIV